MIGVKRRSTLKRVDALVLSDTRQGIKNCPSQCVSRRLYYIKTALLLLQPRCSGSDATLIQWRSRKVFYNPHSQ